MGAPSGKQFVGREARRRRDARGHRGPSNAREGRRHRPGRRPGRRHGSSLGAVTKEVWDTPTHTVQTHDQLTQINSGYSCCCFPLQTCPQEKYAFNRGGGFVGSIVTNTKNGGSEKDDQHVRNSPGHFCEHYHLACVSQNPL